MEIRFITTNKNKNAPSGKEKLELMKFDRRAFNPETGKRGIHVMFKEDKIK